MNLLHRSTSVNGLRLNQRRRIITTGSIYNYISGVGGYDGFPSPLHRAPSQKQYYFFNYNI